MHILHIAPYYAPAWSYGGVVTAVTGLATAQAASGHRVTVLTTDTLSFTERNPLPHETINGVEVIRCRNLSNTLRARYNLASPPGFGSAFRHIQADIVHTHELRTVENLLIDHRYPVVLSPHGTLPYGTGRSVIKRNWDRLFGRRLLHKIDHVAALTTAEAAETRELWQILGIPLPEISIVPNGVPADFSVDGARNLRDRFDLGTGPVVLFLGRLHERKGLQFLIPAFARAASDFPDARLLVVGPDAGMLDTAHKLAAETGIADRVIFTGMLAGADRNAALASADMFVLPAVGEGLSMAALEAMAVGLPLIVTPGCNLPDVESRGAGLLVAREIDPLAGALRALISDANRRKLMGERGRSWVNESFTWSAVAERTEAIYTEIVAGK